MKICVLGAGSVGSVIAPECLNAEARKVFLTRLAEKGITVQEKRRP